MPKLKKIFFSFIVFLIVFTSIVPAFHSVKAIEGDWYNQSFDQWYNKVYDEQTPTEIFGERYTAAQVQWVIYSLMAFIINAPLGNSTDSQATVRCFITNVGDINSCVGALNKLIPKLNPGSLVPPQEQKSLLSLMFADRPFSGISYVKQRASKFSLIPEVNAIGPGFGFGVLEPIQGMWRGSRDIAFALFVLVAIVLAFMIMFRVKISPQVIISVQSAIPKLIIALVLVTFSYAIAGFLVDLMYIVIGIVSLMAPSLTVFEVEPSALFTFLTESNIFVVLIGYIFALVISFISLVAIMIGAPAFALTGSILIVSFWWMILIILVVLVIIAVWTAIKTTWALVKAFANVLLTIIFGPLQIVSGVIIPNFGFGSWIKSLAASLSTFVVTGILLLLSIVFLINGLLLGLKDFFGNSSGALDLGATILHFFIGTAGTHAVLGEVQKGWPPLLGAGDSLSGVGLVFLGVSFVLFTLIPKATEIVQGFITGKPFAYGTAIGEAIGPVNWAYNQGPIRAIREAGSARIGAGILGPVGSAAGALGLQNLSADIAATRTKLEREFKHVEPTSQSAGVNRE